MVSAPILCHLLTPPLMSFTRALSPFVVAGARLSFSRACLNESSLIGQFSQALSLALRFVFRLLRLSFQHFIIPSIFFVGSQDFGRLLFIECQRLEISFRPTDSFHPFFQRYPIYIRITFSFHFRKQNGIKEANSKFIASKAVSLNSFTYARVVM